MLNIDIKAKINEIVEKLKNDDDLLEQFNKNPAKVIEEYRLRTTCRLPVTP